MSVVIFFGSLYVFITPGFSYFTKTGDVYTWLESLDACIKINMTLASQQNVPNTTFLSPGENEPYWIQKLDITKMFPKEINSHPYNESYSIQRNDDNLTHQCIRTGIGGDINCIDHANDVNNLVQLGYFSPLRRVLTINITYRIGSVNYSFLLNEKDSTIVMSCALYYNGEVFSDDCSHRRRAICVKNDFQNYSVSKLDRGLPRFTQHTSSTTGASTPILDTTSDNTHNIINLVTTTSFINSFGKEVQRNTESILYTIIGASVSGIVVLGIVIFSCVVCLFRRRSYDPKQGHRSVNKKRKSDKIDMFDTYSEVADSIARPEVSQDPSGDPDKTDIVQYSTPEDALKFAMTTETEECAIYNTIDPNKRMNMSKANTQNRNDANVYQYLNVENDTNVYDTTNYQNEKVIILEPTYDHFTIKSNART